MYERTLLERIEALEAPKQDTAGQTSADIELESIMSHLRRLLNTNKGSVQIDTDYGMPDMNSFSGEGIDKTMEGIERSVIDLVQKYEKRLANVRVQIESASSDVLKIRFCLEAQLKGDHDIPVYLETSVQPGGRVDISPYRK